MATFTNAGIFDRTFGFGHTTGSAESTTVYDQNSNPSTVNFTSADPGGQGTTNRYSVPAYFSSVYSAVTTYSVNGYIPTPNANGDYNLNGKSAPTSAGTTDKVVGAQYVIGVAGNGEFDRSWGFGDTVTAYNGKAGNASQVAAFNGSAPTFNNTDSGATAPKYFEVSPGNGSRPAPSPDFSGIHDRTSSWGHTTGNNSGTTIAWNGVTYNVPVCHD